ncbi:MAG: hypothetical protein ACXWUG_25950 [Polyangiales bacterium]
MRFISFFAIALVGCGGVVTEQATSSDAGDDTVRIERPEPEGGTSACTRTSDGLTITLTGRVNASCATASVDGGTAPSELVGQIVRVDASSFDLDMCSPAADCVPLIETVQISGAGLDLRKLKQNSYVRVTYHSQTFFGCHSSIAVESIDSWSGVKNPVDVGGRLYLAGGDGMDPTLPFTVERIATGCFTSTSPSCGGGVAPDWFSYRFAGTNVVTMGQTASFTANGQSFRARNLRAFYEGACDAYWDYAFWLIAD